MSSELENGEIVLRLTLEQALRYVDGKRERLRSEVTHGFTLSETGKLTWRMKGPTPVMGLRNIQATLKRFQESLTHTELPSQV